MIFEATLLENIKYGNDLSVSNEDIYDYGSCCKSKIKALYNFYNYFGLIHGNIWEKVRNIWKIC